MVEALAHNMTLSLKNPRLAHMKRRYQRIEDWSWATAETWLGPYCASSENEEAASIFALMKLVTLRK